MAQWARIVRLVPTPHNVRSGASLISPLLRGGPKIELVSPAVFRLLMREPIGFRDRARPGQRIGENVPGLDAACGLQPGANGVAVDGGIDDQMNDMNVLWSKLARHGLSEGPQPEFRRSESGKALAAAEACCGARKEDRAAAARDHDARGFAADQEARVAGELPGLEEQLFRGLDQRLVDVGSGIEQADFDRPDLLLDAGEEVLDLLLLARIDADGVDFVTLGFQLIEQGLGLGGIAAADADGIAALCEAARHRCPDRVAGTDKDRYATAPGHRYSV